MMTGKMADRIEVWFKKLHPDAKLPTYAHEDDAGMDVCAVEDTCLQSYRPTLIRTGLSAQIPRGYELQVRSRSGLALKRGIFVLNSPGTIDSGYTGEIGVILYRATDVVGEGVIRKGDRIAQLVLAPVTTCVPVEVVQMAETERGAGGFGSTGR